MLAIEKRSDAVVRYWRKKGIETITLGNKLALSEFVERVVDDSTGLVSVLDSARSLAPNLEVTPLISNLAGAHVAMREMIAQARRTNLLPTAEGPAVEAHGGSEPGDPRAEARRQAQSKARAILDLASVIDAAVPLDEPMDWVTIGELLYAEGDASGAIQAYQTALRPPRTRVRRLDEGFCDISVGSAQSRPV
jgi:hypothetical protein